MDDLAEAMRWISGNIGTIGFDRDPEVYLMGHSSGAHIALLYLIRRAEEETEEETAARQHAQGLPGVDSATDIASRGGGDGDRGEVGDGGGRQYLEVEGFIGLAGVYDVYRHYLYESWRSVIGSRLGCGYHDDVLLVLVLKPHLYVSGRVTRLGA